MIATYGNNALTNYTYNLYLDQYGYLIGNEEASGEDNYVFIAGYDFTGSHLANATATASAIFLDGTMDNITVDVKETQKNIVAYNAEAYSTHDYPDFNDGTSRTDKSEYNKWFTYVVDDDVYTLSPVDNRMNVSYSDTDYADITPYSVRLVENSSKQIAVAGNNRLGTASTDSRSYGNDDSVYITVDAGSVSAGSDTGITEINSVYTGVDDTKISVDLAGSNGLSNTYSPWSIFAVYDEDLYIIGAIVIGEDNTSTDDYAYILKDVGNEYIDENDDYYWDVEAVVDGEIVTLTIKTDVGSFSGATGLRSRILAVIGAGENGMMELTYDADGYVTDAVSVQGDNTSGTSSAPEGPVYDNDDFGNDVDPDEFGVYVVGWGSAVSNPTEGNFTSNGRTLYAHSSDAGLRLGSGAPVVVVTPREDENGNALSDSIESYSDFKAAVESLDNGNNNNGYDDFDGWITAVINDNGQAAYVVISSNDALVVDVNTGEGRPSENSVIDDVVLVLDPSSSNGTAWPTLLDEDDAPITSGNFKYTLYMRGPGQATFAEAVSGTCTPNSNGQFVLPLPGNGTTDIYSYYVVVDGVTSNTITVTHS